MKNVFALFKMFCFDQRKGKSPLLLFLHFLKIHDRVLRTKLYSISVSRTLYRVSEADRLRPACAMDPVQHCQQQCSRRHRLILVFHHHLRQQQ